MIPQARGVGLLAALSLALVLLAGGSAAATVHAVKPGESLQQVALQHGVTAELLREANAMPVDLILAGQRLLVPGPWDLVHEVAPGESIWMLSRRYRIGVEELLEANQLTRVRFYPGERLVIPGALLTRDPPDYATLHQELGAMTAEHPEATFSIYLRDLASGATLTLGDDEPVRAASTVKVPIALHAYRLAAAGELSLDQRVAYHRENHFATGAGALQYFALEGQQFPMGHLLKLMISLSDNVAWAMVREELGHGNIVAFMREAGGETVFPAGENVTTARDMATYLNNLLALYETHPELAALLIRDLRHSMWITGIRAGVPEEIPVAHKVGTLFSPTGLAADVAIVGGPRPYILCILADGWAHPDLGHGAITRMARAIHDVQAGQPPAPGALPVDFFP